MSAEKWYLRFLILLTFSGLIYIKFINRTVFGIAFLLLVALFFQKCFLKIRYIFMLLIAAFSVIIALMYTNGYIYNFNMPMYYLFWILYAVYVSANTQSFMRNLFEDQKFIISATKLWCIITTICMFIPNCYVTMSDGSRGFVAFAGVDVASGANRLCPVALFVLTMIYICMSCYKKKEMIYYSIPCLYVFFMGGSRTYFAVGCALFVVCLYNFFDKKVYFYLTILPVIMIGFMLVNISAMGTRIEENTWTSNSYGDYWFILTSGRSKFWVTMLTAYKNQPWINKLLGNGFNFTVDTAGHWGHNDFIEIICSHGIIGLCLYLYSFSVIFKITIRKVKLPIIINLLVVFIWLFNAFFNMFYTYIYAAIPYPILLCGVYYEYRSSKKAQSSHILKKVMSPIQTQVRHKSDTSQTQVRHKKGKLLC